MRISCSEPALSGQTAIGPMLDPEAAGYADFAKNASEWPSARGGMGALL